MAKRFLFFFIVGLFLLTGCGEPKEFTSFQELVSYTNKPANGLVKTLEGSAVRVTARFLPPAYLAYQEIKKNNLTASKKALDSLTYNYSRTYTFQLTIEPRNPADNLPALLHKFPPAASQTTQEKNMLNYEMDNYVNLSIGKNVFKPVLFTLENTADAEKRMVYLFVFDPKGPVNAAEAAISLLPTFFLQDSMVFNFDTEAFYAIPQLVIKS